MEKILFKGKTKNRKVAEWIEGSLVLGISKYNGEPVHFIYEPQTLIDSRGWIGNYYGEEVDPETVGQYIGAVDKNGKKIFKGDIVYLPSDGFREHEYFEVKYAFGQFYIGINGPIGNYRASMCEVVGNIWDSHKFNYI